MRGAKKKEAKASFLPVIIILQIAGNDYAAIFVVLCEWLNGVTVSLDVNLAVEHSLLLEKLSNLVGTLLRVLHVKFRITSVLVGITLNSDCLVLVVLEPEDDVVE